MKRPWTYAVVVLVLVLAVTSRAETSVRVSDSQRDEYAALHGIAAHIAKSVDAARADTSRHAKAGKLAGLPRSSVVLAEPDREIVIERTPHAAINYRAAFQSQHGARAPPRAE